MLVLSPILFMYIFESKSRNERYVANSAAFLRNQRLSGSRNGTSSNADKGYRHLTDLCDNAPLQDLVRATHSSVQWSSSTPVPGMIRIPERSCAARGPYDVHNGTWHLEKDFAKISEKTIVGAANGGG